MDQHENRRRQEAIEAIMPGNNLAFCTRCGQPVDAYESNDCGLVRDQHDDYALPVESGEDRPALSGYRCPHCCSQWVAISCQDTGLILGCGHFAPVYADFCATCGRSASVPGS